VEARRQQEAATARTLQQKQQAEAQAAAAEEKRKQEAALAAAAAERERQQRAAAAAAAAEEQRQKQAAAAAAAEERRQAEVAQRAEAQRKQDLLAAAPAPAVHAAAAEPAAQEGGSTSGGAEVDSKRKALTFVGFDGKQSRVFVRTNGPVRYTVSSGAKNTVVLELDNTSIPLHNNTRALDTAFFAGPVLRIQPGRGPKNSVLVAITLRDAVAYQTHQDGNEVSVQFQAP
jgi:colicin import membrane protein